MKYEIKIHPLNVKGKYYVDQESCIVDDCCCVEAPKNFRIDTDKYNESNFGAYVFKQPETPEEEKDCKNAMDVCPTAAIHDDGI